MFDIESAYPLLDESTLAAGTPAPAVRRAQGCLLGQLAGDALGSLVEFKGKAEIRRLYPAGIRHLADGGTFSTIAGQPTDDSEMALILARSIVKVGTYDQEAAAIGYARWFESGPFDYGGTTAQALHPAVAAVNRAAGDSTVAKAATSAASRESQANGALMRVSPLGIFAHGLSPARAAELARKDASLTHPHPVCQDASAVLVVAVATAISSGAGVKETYESVLKWALSDEGSVDKRVIECLQLAAGSPPPDFQHQQGWVMIALRNAFWQLLHAPSLEAGVCDSVMRGGDTDTNAAIAGSLLGAVYGADALPAQWRDALLNCRPEIGRPNVHRPRPAPFWPVDSLRLAERLVELGS
jgi:ADP-ribosyl-[dinitrogen reductase] hydrolase